MENSLELIQLSMGMENTMYGILQFSALKYHTESWSTKMSMRIGTLVLKTIKYGTYCTRTYLCCSIQYD